MSSQSVTETLATEVRILGRIGQETLGGIRRTGWMNLVIAVTMASILSIFGTVMVTVIETQLFMDNIGSTLQISVYLDEDSEMDTLAATIERMPHVRKVDKIPKETSWEEVKEIYEIPDIQNPLPDTIHVAVTNQEMMEKVYLNLKDLPGIIKVNYPQSILRRLQGLAQLSSVVGMFISIFLSILTMFIISNTIHLLIQARSREIEILRMMGVGNWYIRLPFLFQGAMYGILGAVIAYMPLYFSEFYMSQVFQYFQFSSSGYSVGVVTIVMALMGLIVGAGGAAFSIHKYLRI